MRYQSGQNVVDSRETTKTFRFYDEDEYEIWMPVFGENTWQIYNPHD